MLKENQCLTCKTQYSYDKSNPEKFVYKNFTFTVETDWSCLECEKQSMIKRFEEHGTELVIMEEGKVKINWRNYIHTYNTFRQETYSEEVFNAKTQILMALDILSCEIAGNWAIYSMNNSCLNNPCLSLSPLYFTHREDVIEYAKETMSNTLYTWSIIHCDDILHKNEVLKKKN